MMIQVAMFHLIIVDFIIDIHNVISIKNHFTNFTLLVDIVTSILWATRCILEIIVFNYICERVYMKVKFE